MTRPRWITPEQTPSAYICRRLWVPDDPEWLANVSGCLNELCKSWNFEEYGAITPDEAAAFYQAMYDGYLLQSECVAMLGVIVPCVTATVPPGCLLCDGTYYNRVQYPALYAVLDPVFIIDPDVFQLPDLRGRGLIGIGQGSGLSDRFMSEIGGEETHQLTEAELAAHSHATDGHGHFTHSHFTGLAVEPGEFVVSLPNPLGEYTASANEGIQSTGSDTPHENMHPFMAVRWVIVAF